MKNRKIIYRIIDHNGENRRLDYRYVFLGVFMFVAVATMSFMQTRNMTVTSAADLTKFKPGNIMSDEVMRNYTSMTEAQIQAFLKSKNKCNNTNISEAAKYPTVTYHIKDGHFVCMADDLFENNDTAEQETAAHIIWQAAQDYKINPQVIITLLEKEQGLVTDTWPNSIQYRSATGYGCPDTAKCNSKYYGFYNQVRNAAALFNTVLSGGWTNYPVGNNYIYYNPDKSCGGSTVYVENLATSALYRYTPYQPNAGALKAYTGTAPCGAYGNRNFFIYFSDWFGSTTVAKVEKTFGETYYEKNSSTTGKLVGVSNCVDENNKVADLTKQGEYFCSQDYDKGSLYWKTTIGSNGTKVENGQFWLTGETNDIYKTLDKGLIKNLGAVKGNVKTVTDSSDGKTYKTIEFERGVVMKNDESQKIISDVLYTTWLAQQQLVGNVKGEIKTFEKDSSLRMLECEKGVVIGSDKYGYYAIKEKAYNKWLTYKDSLGYPRSALGSNTKTGIEWYTFDNGLLVGNDKKGWFLSVGKSRAVWQKYGFESGVLGYPTSDLQKNTKTGMEWQVYEGGYIVGNDKNGWFVSYGKSRAVWQRKGFESGVLGFPTSNIECNSRTGMCWQNYEKGLVVGNDKKGWFESRGNIRAKWRATGFESGRYGWPQSDITGNRQKYTGGWIYQ